MQTSGEGRVSQVVVDSAAFFKRASLQAPLPELLKSVRPPEDSSAVGDETSSESDSNSEDELSKSDSDEQTNEYAGKNVKNQSCTPSADEWITEHNFSQRVQSNCGLGVKFDDEEPLNATSTESIKVGCLSTDFAVQNVLLHASLPILSLNGLRIKQPRTRILWCSACFRPTKRVDIYFCPSCGHASLRRIPVTLHSDGRLEFHFSRKFKFIRRGLQQPVHKPKGGKHANEPIYCADQRLPDRRPARLKHPNVQPIASNGLLTAFDEDEDDNLADALDANCNLLAGDSIFPLHDVNTRSALIGLRHDGQVGGIGQQMHGLKPTRGRAHLAKPRIGRKARKRTGY